MTLRALSVALALTVSVDTLHAQNATPSDTTPPAAAPADVQSMDAIMHAVYDVISGPAGERNWQRFYSLFAPGARLIPTRHDSTGTHLRVLTPQAYGQLAGKYFLTSGFFEHEIGRETNTFGAITQLFSAYASRHAADDAKPFARGINSFQLFNDGTRWYIVTIYWDDERAGQTIPKRYLTGQ